MFRALKDILQDKPPHQYHDKYYYSGERAPGTSGQYATRDLPRFYPVESYPREDYGTEGVVVDLERREVTPVVQETIHPSERVEIQPVLRREREQIEVREITQPILEKGTIPVAIHEEVLPEERKEMPPVPQDAIEEQLRKAKEGLAPMKKREPTIRTVEEKPIIVEESVHKRIFEEIVPVVERHVNEPHLIREKRPIYEKIYEGPTIVTRELPRIEREVPVQFLEPSLVYGGPPAGGAQTYGYGREGYYGGHGGREGYYGGREGYYGGYGGKEAWTRGRQYQPGVGSFVDVPVQQGFQPRSELSPGQVRYAC